MRGESTGTSESGLNSARPAPATTTDSQFSEGRTVCDAPSGQLPSTEDFVPRDDGRRRTRLPQIPGYEVLEVLGKGGMGIVYKARQLHPRRTVALKMVRAGQYASDDAIQRFRTEIEAAAQLQHQNIVHLYELGTADDLPFFTMELVEGGTLDRAAAKRSFSLHEAAAMVETLARAVHYAHERGIIHRDLKPGNVLLTPDGHPKITDFGLAKLATPSSDSPATQAGDQMGTPDYMAPEQAAGDSMHAGPAADIYSLGVILYELITGRRPFTGESVVRQILEEDPPSPAWLKPGMDRDLETICLKCLRKDPAQRYETALDLADDLRRYLEGRPIRGRRPSLLERVKTELTYRPRRALGAVAAIAAACAVLAGLAYADFYVLEHAAYYGQFTKRWGVPVGLAPVPAAAVSRRQTTFRFVRRGRYGPVIRLEVVDCAGKPTPQHEVLLWIDGIREALAEKTRESIYEFRYTPDGLLSEELGYVSGRSQPLWILQYHYQQGNDEDPRRVVLAKFLDPRGAAVSDSGGAGALEFHRNAEGFDELIRFVDHRANPQQTAASRLPMSFGGVYAAKLTFDERGLPRRMAFRDAEGNPMPNSIGVFQIALEYDPSGLPSEYCYLDAGGKPTHSALRLHSGHLQYDADGNLSAEEYRDVDGNPALATMFGSLLPVSRIEFEYQSGRTVWARGRLGGDVVFAVQHQQWEDGGRVEIATLHDVAGVRTCTVSRYDPEGKCVEVENFGPQGKELQNRLKYAYANGGQRTEEIAYDRDGDRVLHRTTWKYDPQTGRLLEESHFGEGGQGLLSRKVWSYDEVGRPAVETHLAADGRTEVSKITRRYAGDTHRVVEQILETYGDKPTTLRTVFTYNERGDLIRETHTDPAQNPLACEEGHTQRQFIFAPDGRLLRDVSSGFASGYGYAQMVRHYDDAGRTTLVEYLDEQGEPARSTKLGFSRKTTRYNRFGWIESTEETGYDGSEGFARRVSKVGSLGQETVYAYYDAQGNPVRHSAGNLEWIVRMDPSGVYKEWEITAGYEPARGYYAKADRYDAAGKLVETRFQDARGELVRGPLGFARQVVTSDAAQRSTKIEYFDERNRPARHPDGNSAYIAYFDESGSRLIKDELTGFEAARGYHRRTASYDAARRVVEYAYFDADGKLVMSPQGFARVQCQYEESGALKHVTYFGADGRTLKGTPAVTIVQVLPETPAQRLGLKAGDVLKSYNGLRLDSQCVLMNEQDRIKNQPGPIAIEVERDGKPLGKLEAPVGKLGIVVEDRFQPD
jgi:tRNA A-37 threonylcarbamoyl transferase component Bud32